METTNPGPWRFAAPVARSLNSAFNISLSQDASVSYSVDIQCSMSLTSGQQGTVFLEQADDSGFTINVEEICRFTNGNTGTLTIGLALVQNVTGTVSGTVKSGRWARLRTQNNVGVPVFTYRSGQEVILN